MSQLIAPYVSSMFTGVAPGWKKIIFSPQLRPHLQTALSGLGDYLADHGVTAEHLTKNGLARYIRPKPEQIFEAFKYFDPHNLRVIIIGQDPYPKAENACGLSFSLPPECRPSKSLEVIYRCLEHSGLLGTDDIRNGDLRSWAKQGILLLNFYLTRSPDIRRNSAGETWIEGNGDSSSQFLHAFWEPFMVELIRLTTAAMTHHIAPYPNWPCSLTTEPYLAVMLWGKFAQSLASIVDPAAITMTWCHPANALSENNPAHFIHCDHFTRVSQKCTINWKPEAKINIDLRAQYCQLPPEQIEAAVEDQWRRGILYDDGTSEMPACAKNLLGQNSPLVINIYAGPPISVLVDGMLVVGAVGSEQALILALNTAARLFDRIGRKREIRLFTDFLPQNPLNAEIKAALIRLGFPDCETFPIAVN